MDKGRQNGKHTLDKVNLAKHSSAEVKEASQV